MARLASLFVLITGLHESIAFSFVPSHASRSGTSVKSASSSSSYEETRTKPRTRMSSVSGPDVQHTQTRIEAVQAIWRTTLAVGAAQAFLATPALAEETMTTPSGLKIKKLVAGQGPQVVEGDLVGVRFKGNYGNYEFDNIFNTAEPYYMRAGVGTLVKGVEEALLMMKVGDKWLLTCPAELAFGNKGRPPSPGRPRIPPGAEVEYTLELVALPGKEEDMLNNREDNFTGDAFDAV